MPWSLTPLGWGTAAWSTADTQATVPPARISLPHGRTEFGRSKLFGTFEISRRLMAVEAPVERGPLVVTALAAGPLYLQPLGAGKGRLVATGESVEVQDGDTLYLLSTKKFPYVATFSDEGVPAAKRLRRAGEKPSAPPSPGAAGSPLSAAAVATAQPRSAAASPPRRQHDGDAAGANTSAARSGDHPPPPSLPLVPLPPPAALLLCPLLSVGRDYGFPLPLAAQACATSLAKLIERRGRAKGTQPALSIAIMIDPEENDDGDAVEEALREALFSVRRATRFASDPPHAAAGTTDAFAEGSGCVNGVRIGVLRGRLAQPISDQATSAGLAARVGWPAARVTSSGASSGGGSGGFGGGASVSSVDTLSLSPASPLLPPVWLATRANFCLKSGGADVVNRRVLARGGTGLPEATRSALHSKGTVLGGVYPIPLPEESPLRRDEGVGVLVHVRGPTVVPGAVESFHSAAAAGAGGAAPPPPPRVAPDCLLATWDALLEMFATRAPPAFATAAAQGAVVSLASPFGSPVAVRAGASPAATVAGVPSSGAFFSSSSSSTAVAASAEEQRAVAACVSTRGITAGGRAGGGGTGGAFLKATPPRPGVAAPPSATSRAVYAATEGDSELAFAGAGIAASSSAGVGRGGGVVIAAAENGGGGGGGVNARDIAGILPRPALNPPAVVQPSSYAPSSSASSASSRVLAPSEGGKPAADAPAAAAASARVALGSGSSGGGPFTPFFTGSNLGALTEYAARPLKYLRGGHGGPHGAVLAVTPNGFVIVADAYPKSQIHLLVLAADPPASASSSSPSSPPLLGHQLAGLRTPSDLREHHLPALRAMGEAGVAALAVADAAWRKAHGRAVSPGAPLLGFHALPSLTPLHLHVLTDDFHSDCVKKRQHYASFTTGFFRPLEDVERKLEADPAYGGGRLNIVEATMKRVLNDAPLHCHRCEAAFKTLPQLKGHLRDCAPGCGPGVPPATAAAGGGPVGGEE